MSSSCPSGILTGENFPWHSPLFNYGLINMDVGSGNSIDGLTLIDSPEFYVASFTHAPTLRNVKMVCACVCSHVRVCVSTS